MRDNGNMDHFYCLNNDDNLMSTYNYGGSVYSDIINYHYNITSGIYYNSTNDYYKPSNTPSEANWLYHGVDSPYPYDNYIEDGIFRKVDDNVFVFNYESGDIEENHVYNYNHLRLSTESIDNFVSDGKITFTVKLEGYSSAIDVNMLILRQFLPIIFTDKDNLNNEKWSLTGYSTASNLEDGGLELTSGEITLNENIVNYPTKEYFDINDNTKYRFLATIIGNDDTIAIKLDQSGEYIISASSLSDGMNSIELTYDNIDSWQLYCNGERDLQFTPTIFESIDNLIPSICLVNDNSGDGVEIVELKNQVFKKIDFSDSSDWDSVFSDTTSLTIADGDNSGDCLNYKDISLDREIIFNFNEDFFSIDSIFEDLRLWSDIELGTNYNQVEQGLYDPNFALFDYPQIGDLATQNIYLDTNHPVSDFSVDDGAGNNDEEWLVGYSLDYQTQPEVFSDPNEIYSFGSWLSSAGGYWVGSQESGTMGNGLLRLDINNNSFDSSLSPEQIFINDFQVNLDFLQEKLEKILENRTDRAVYLRAEKEISYGMVVRVMSEIKAAGVEKLGMVTQPGEEDRQNRKQAKRSQ